jgi:serine/threonine-protein kinase mTOR
VDTVLYLRDSKYVNVKMQVMLLIPKMSAFAPEKFVVAYLDTCTQHLLNVMSKDPPSLANTAFTCFGQMLAPLAAPQSVMGLRSNLQQYLPEIEAQILDACSPKQQNTRQDHARRTMAAEAIACAATLAEVWLSFHCCKIH